jgi:HK97 family phage major capsid protein
MSLLTANKAAAQLAAAFKTQDDAEMEKAWEAFGDEVCEKIRADFADYESAKNDSVLAQRGYRVLTSNEKAWYANVANALKSVDPKQAFIDILTSDDKNDIMPETIIEDVLKYLQETRPLLAKVKFQNAGFSTKWIINDNSVQRGGWGKIDASITDEIEGSLKVLVIEQSKYSAFCIIPLDILDMGPQFLDAFIRATLAEALGLGLEEAIVNGSGVNMPCGMMRNPNGSFNQSTGYPAKTPVKVTSFAPAEYGALVAKVAKTEKGKQRTFGSVGMLCNMSDYLTKIMPATTMLTANGGYASNLFPFPTEVIQCNAVPEGKAVLGILDDYTLAVGGKRNGNIEFDDSVKFLDDARTFKLVQHAAGRAYDNTSFIVLDISDLDPAYITVKNTATVAGDVSVNSKTVTA